MNRLELNDYKNRIELMSDWHERLYNAQRGHYVCSEKLYNKADLTGYALILSSTIVTGCLFFDAQGWWKFMLVTMSILSAALSGLVSFGRFSEKAELHRAAAGNYGKLRRQLENLHAKKDKLDDDALDIKLKVLRIEWEYISQNSPLTPKSALKNRGV